MNDWANEFVTFSLEWTCMDIVMECGGLSTTDIIT
jgi:hypothetical protein